MSRAVSDTVTILGFSVECVGRTALACCDGTSSDTFRYGGGGGAGFLFFFFSSLCTEFVLLGVLARWVLRVRTYFVRTIRNTTGGKQVSRTSLIENVRDFCRWREGRYLL